ncbi:DtxR family transcriptional regulator [Thermococci archaeon]|nr:MAG: DtxR family transcriptional regulator [Thermococci archaeon]
MPVTHRLEDYLKAIFLLTLGGRVTRVKEISEALGVSRSTVTSALRTLSEKGLVKHEHYGYVELTPRGAELARALYERNKLLHVFLREILGVNEEVAERDACSMEHHLSAETLEKIKELVVEAMRKDNRRLSDLGPGEEGKVLRIVGHPIIKKKLLGMGITPGVKIRVERVAPLGDPIEVKAGGTLLSLRKEEADCIWVDQ